MKKINYAKEYKGYEVVMHFGLPKEVSRFYRLKKNLEKDPNNVELLIELGALCSVVFEGPKDAGIALERAIDIDPSNWEAYFWLARTHRYDVGDKGTAKYILEQSLIFDDKNSYCQGFLVEVSDEFYKDREEKYVGSVRAMLRKYPTYVASHDSWGRYLFLKRDFEGATQAYGKSKKLMRALEKKTFSLRTRKYDKDFMPRMSSWECRIDFTNETKGCDGMFYEEYKEKKYNSSIRGRLSKLISRLYFWKKSDPLLSLLQQEKTPSKRRQSRLKKSLLKKIKEAFCKKKEPQKAGVALLLVIEQNPRNWEGYFWLAKMLLYECNDVQLAKDVVEQSLFIDDKNDDCQMLHIEASTRVFRKQQRLVASDVALNQVTEAIEKHPTWMAPYVNLAYHLISQKKFEIASKAFIEACKIEDDLKQCEFSPKTKKLYEKFISENGSIRYWTARLANDIWRKKRRYFRSIPIKLSLKERLLNFWRK